MNTEEDYSITGLAHLWHAQTHISGLVLEAPRQLLLVLARVLAPLIPVGRAACPPAWSKTFVLVPHAPPSSTYARQGVA